MKNKKLIIMLIVAIFLVLIMDLLFLFIRFKQNQNNENSMEMIQRFSCYKEESNYVNPDNGISLKGNESYSFYVMKDKSLKADISRTNMTFNNLDDLNTYHDYLINVYNYTINDHNYFEIDDKSLTLSYFHNGFYGSNQSNLEEYLNWLSQNNYVCTETEIELD